MSFGEGGGREDGLGRGCEGLEALDVALGARECLKLPGGVREDGEGI